MSEHEFKECVYLGCFQLTIAAAWPWRTCTRLDQARPEMLDLGKPTPLLASGQWERFLTLPSLCMTFHEMENGFEPYLRVPIWILYLYSTRCGGQSRSGTPRRTLLELLRGFSSRVFLFFPSFFSNREQVPPVWHGPRDLNLSGPASCCRGIPLDC